jgi:hypothetical protein
VIVVTDVYKVARSRFSPQGMWRKVRTTRKRYYRRTSRWRSRSTRERERGTSARWGRGGRHVSEASPLRSQRSEEDCTKLLGHRPRRRNRKPIRRRSPLVLLSNLFRDPNIRTVNDSNQRSAQNFMLAVPLASVPAVEYVERCC